MTGTPASAGSGPRATAPERLTPDHGLLLRAAHLVGLLPGRGGLVRVGIVLAVVTWLPLVLLEAIYGSGPGTTMSLWQSIATHVRLLVALPALFLAESLFSTRIHGVINEMLAKGIVPEADQPRFTRTWRRTQRLWGSWHVEAVLLVLTLVTIYAGLGAAPGMRPGLPTDVITWRGTAEGGLTAAGRWYALVSLPVFRFVLWRWMWRLLIWSALLWRTSKMNLRLTPTHPDHAGGIGTLGVAHVDLSPLNFAMSATLAATYAEEIKFAAVPLVEYTTPVTAAVVGLTALSLVPLFFFSRRLVEVKQRGLLDYGGLATDYVQAFHRKWLQGGAGDEPLIGSADVQSLADLGNSVGAIQDMQLLPISWSQISTLALAAALPMLPLVLFAIPLDQIIIGGIRSLVGA